MYHLMCGRFVNYVGDKTNGAANGAIIDMSNHWSELLKIWPDVNLSYNVSPSQTIAAFRGPAGKAMRWGLIPHWAKEFESEFSTFNARLETLADKPAFRDAWRNNQRCLIPMLGYYEWQGEKGNKQPYFIHSKNANDQYEGLVVAGLYDQWGSSGNYSCTVITKPANAKLEEIHPRMPVLLTPLAAKQWMNLDQNQALDYLLNVSAPDISFHAVTKSVGNSKSNGRRLIESTEDA